MLKQMMDIDEMVGKTIKNIEYLRGGEMIIVFMDALFICLHPKEGYDNDVFISPKGKIEIDTYSDISEIVEAGIITMPEYNEMMEAKRAKKIRIEEATDNRELERLKAKYESGSKP